MSGETGCRVQKGLDDSRLAGLVFLARLAVHFRLLLAACCLLPGGIMVATLEDSVLYPHQALA